MERWLLLSNCQTFGLANSFNLLHPGFSISGVDIWGYRSRQAEINNEMGSYFRVVAHPEITQLPGFDEALAPNLATLPAVEFDGYHPDLCYAASGDRPIKGPLGDYQSIVAVAGYNAGLSVAETLRLYRRETYERCGYFDLWQPARERLLQDFSLSGIDLAPLFRRWTARRAFMYSLNHPRIEVLYDVARLFMRRLGVATLASDLTPADNLANGPCFPVYPEIGEAFGVPGSYMFKVFGEYRLLSLEDFVVASFEAFSKHPRGSIGVHAGDRLARLRTLIGAA